jgi:hypothetical protein
MLELASSWAVEALQLWAASSWAVEALQLLAACSSALEALTLQAVLASQLRTRVEALALAAPGLQAASLWAATRSVPARRAVQARCPAGPRRFAP